MAQIVKLQDAMVLAEAGAFPTGNYILHGIFFVGAGFYSGHIEYTVNRKMVRKEFDSPEIGVALLMELAS